MLYDKRWDAKVDLFDLQKIRAWLASKPPGKIYDFVDNRRCLYCQYFRSTGMREVLVSADEVRGVLDGEKVVAPIPESLKLVAMGLGFDAEWTFGRALARIERLILAENAR